MRLKINGTTVGQSYNGNIGVAPMDLDADKLTTIQEITIHRLGDNANVVAAGFTSAPIRKNLPKGLWGTRQTQDVNAKSLVRGAVGGFQITPSGVVGKGAAQAIAVSVLEDSAPEGNNQQFDFGNAIEDSSPLTVADIRDFAGTHANRNTLLTDLLGANAPVISLGGINANAFLFEAAS